MFFVKEVDDIRRNLETFDGCLRSKNGEERPWAAERLRLGKNFVAGALRGRVIFGPSRFMGARDNSRDAHSSVERGVSGETDKAIDKILDRIKFDHPDRERLEGLYQELCEGLDINPASHERTYWDLDYDSGFVDLDTSYVEGRQFPAVVMRSERSAAARAACIAAHGGDPSCVVCGFNFTESYGKRGKDFIHVHHLDPLAKGIRKVRPETDLVPVCANCHCMLHRGELLKPEELKGMMPKTPCTRAAPAR